LYSYLWAHKKYLIQLPLILYWIILFVLTSLPATLAITTKISDKINHFGAYGLLSVLLYLNLYFQYKFKLPNKYPALFTVLIASFYGFLDEMHQMLVPGRSAEFLDWFADFSGSLVAVIITSYLIRKLKQIDFEKSKLNSGTFQK